MVQSKSRPLSRTKYFSEKSKVGSSLPGLCLYPVQKIIVHFWDVKFYPVFFIDTCLSGYFSCAQSKGCVLESRLCDGIINCPDRSDELEVAGCGKSKCLFLCIYIFDLAPFLVDFIVF